MSDFNGLTELNLKENKTSYSDHTILIEKDCFNNKPQYKISINKKYDIFGLGETPGLMKRNKTNSIFYNTDNAGHKKDSPMYKHLPIILLVPKDMNEHSYLIWTNTKERIEFYCQEIIIYIKCHTDHNFNLKILKGTDLSDIYRRYFNIEGIPFKPPIWSLGYHQSKYSYYSKEEVDSIIENFERLDIPLETIWLDIDYMDEYRVFTVDTSKYNKLKNMTKKRRLVTILDPAIKLDYWIENDGTKEDIWVKDRNNNDNLEVEVWAGKSYLPDFTMKKCREWWATKVNHFINKYNVSGLWIDMNEPSLINSLSTNPDPMAIHRADEELGGIGTHDKYHNMYGYLMSCATYEGMVNARPEKRPFILTRSTTLGGQKYAAVWTGDNNSSWEHLHESIRMCINLSLSGIPFSGVDVGGFLENSNDELFSRWMGIAAWFPFYRNHTNNFTRPQEIWSFSSKTLNICREAIYRRYKLMRYLYTQIIRTSIDKELFLKPIFWDTYLDSNLKNNLLERSFIIGGLLVICQTKKELSSDSITCIDGYKEIRWKNDIPELPKLFLKNGKLLYKNSQIITTDDLNKDYNLRIIINKDDNNYADEYFYYDNGDGDGTNDHFWYGKIVYNNGNLSFQRISGNRQLPKFCCQMHFI